MSDPLSATCAYCGSPEVLDDAWWCHRSECWVRYEEDSRAEFLYERRTPLTLTKARIDLFDTKASVWGHGVGDINAAAERLDAILHP